uniref:PDZ domain-containing protein n=1 Tax=Phytophthora ramorum TaxID=164328 RepID=H3GXS6_PHYRM
MVDAEVQTDAPMPAAVVGVEQDLLMGVRVRKSFGSHAFWGTVVGCYWVSGGLFYKVSFDDGDVDIFSADEVLQDAQQAKTHAKENAKENAQKDPASSETPVDEYLTTMRHHSLKRKRDEPVDTSVRSVRRVQLWGQRLYASIYTNEQNETFIKELIKTDSGQMGEMEATGQVKVGDMILAVNQKRVLGLESKDVAELIKKPQRPIVLTLYRPQHSQLPVQQQQAGQASAPAPEQAQGAATTQPAAVVTQPQAQQQAPASAPMRVLPASFVAPQRAFAQPASMGPGLAQSWTQPMNTHGMTNRELLRQRLIQAAAARQPGYFPMTGVFAPANRGVPTAQRGGLTDQQMQRIVDAAAMRLHASADPPVSSTDNADAEAIAALAEKDPAAAASAMATSFLSPQACPDSKAGAASTAESSLSMSFLSPNDFNEESRMPPRRDLSAGSAKSTPSPVKSNVSLTTVVVHRQRLYLTLGVQGALIAVTSFVSDETGQRGEVEASGRVFLGDVLPRDDAG